MEPLVITHPPPGGLVEAPSAIFRLHGQLPRFWSRGQNPARDKPWGGRGKKWGALLPERTGWRRENWVAALCMPAADVAKVSPANYLGTPPIC
ncbi:hypothetical protein HPB50_002244 [Hyalomma asiaticum]|uniref:Uncharacterized protein n=1 Tax=Hyalomma asiaticum TaxID=266040 RepID=A0ACB7T9L2_HYAAI|nr:hypothetical protein HPB50_002244 [Hyalomma asiaticum]